MFGNCRLSDLEEVEPPLQDVSKRGLGQLLKESLADLGEEGRDLIFVVLLLKTSIVEDDELGRPGQSR